MLAVEAHGLPPDAGIEPAVKDSGAGANRRLACLRRCPRHAKPRLERRVVVDARLIAVAQARTEREPFVNTEIVLEVHPKPGMKKVQCWIADAPRVEKRRAGFECLEAA